MSDYVFTDLIIGFLNPIRCFGYSTNLRMEEPAISKEVSYSLVNYSGLDYIPRSKPFDSRSQINKYMAVGM